MAIAQFPTSLSEAEAFDRKDPLGFAKAAFVLPEGVTYLVGHSLGPATHTSLARLRNAAEQEWAEGLVGSWNSAGWIDLPKRVGAKLARLIGVRESEVVTCDSVSVNIFKLAASLIETNGMSRRLIVETGEFPTDQYMISRLSQLMQTEFLHVEPGQGLAELEGGGVLVKSLVDFRSGAIEDITAYEETANRSGGAVIWDLSHATGVLDLHLGDAGARYAIGCTYKYVNGGPGAPAFIYVRNDCLQPLTNPLPGWLGHARPFAFEPSYESAPDIQRFVSGTPNILSLAALDGALEVFDTVSLPALQQKANRLGDMCLAEFARSRLPSTSPGIGSARGGHVSVHHENGYAISRALAERGHKTDFRTPDTIRWGLSPLYLSYADVWKALADFADILETRCWTDARFQVVEKVT